MRANAHMTQMLLVALILSAASAIAQNQLGAPAQVWPWDNAANVPARQTLAWLPVDGANAYELQLATSNSFSQLFVQREDIALTLSTITDMAPATTYYWRVRAVDGGTNGAWSTTRAFSTAAPTPAGSATLRYPADLQINAASAAAFVWTVVNEAATYALQLSPTPDFSVLVLNVMGISDTTMSSSGLEPGQTYYWRIAAENAAGKGPWSEVRTFTTATSAGTAVRQARVDEPSLNVRLAGSTLTYTVARTTPVRIRIVDLSGRMILNKSELATAGTHAVRIPSVSGYSGRVVASVSVDR